MSIASIKDHVRRSHPGEYPESCADPECRERQALLAVAEAAARYFDSPLNTSDYPDSWARIKDIRAALDKLEALP